jgi:hypothetical protein
MPDKPNSFTYIRAVLVLHDRGCLAHARVVLHNRGCLAHARVVLIRWKASRVTLKQQVGSCPRLSMQLRPCLWLS